MRVASRGAAAAVLCLGLLVAGCGGGGGDATSTKADPGGAVTVTVVNGDTRQPVAGATVVGTRSGQVVATVTSGDDGTAQVPQGTRLVTVTADGFSNGAHAVGSAPLDVPVFDPDLQSPEYGGGPARNRYVPAVVAPLPSGNPDWTFESRTLIEFPPAVDNGLLVFGVNSGRVYGLDAETGAVRWARRQKGEIASSPAISGNRVFVSSMDGMLSAYGLGGTPRWQFSTSGSPIESSPLVVDGRVFVGAWNGTLYAVDAETGKAVWTFQAAADIKGSAALAGGSVVVADYAGNVYALDPATGAERWRYSGGKRFYGGPAVSGTTLVIGDVGGAVIALNVNTGRELWRHATSGYVYSSPAIARGTVFIGSYSGQFEALSLADGSPKWSFNAGERISGSATVVGDVVYTAILAKPGTPPKTFGLDTGTGKVRYTGDDGRYSPAVAAGVTLYLVGTRIIDAYRDPTP